MPLINSVKPKMILKDNLLLVLSLCLITYCCEGVQGENKTELKKCKTDQQEQCPPNFTSCVQVKDTDGLCTCLKGYEFNTNFTSDENYCVVAANVSKSNVTTTIVTSTSPTTIKTTKAVPVTTKIVSSSSTSTTTTTTTTTTKAPEKSTTTTTKPPTTTSSPLPVPDDGVQKEKVIEPEHMIGGVLLPLLVVMTFIGGVYLIRKHNLLERTHNYLTERNWHLPGSARPNYTNDFDEFDDPLLI